MAKRRQPDRAQSGPDRRSALLLSAALGAGAALGRSEPSQAQPAAPAIMHRGPYAVSTPPSLVAKTAYGDVRGYLRGDIEIFKGVPYGADTGGANRWMPPRPPQPWRGVRPALTYGPISPQDNNLQTWISNPEKAFIQNWNGCSYTETGQPLEDMLRLNVWTGGRSGKRPVIVWIHGGGYSVGSAMELPYYDGENLARRGVVLVSVTHRLNCLGYLDLSQIGGDAYRDSANAGMLDLVQALEWVRDNIARFGGDPHNVTIMGQSGGGSKVTTLMAMPSAAGLFHRAAVQSGGAGDMPDSDDAQAYSAQVMKELGLAAGDVKSLQAMAWERLNAACGAARLRMIREGAKTARVGNTPVCDGRVILSRSFFDGAPALSRNIPVLVGSVREEGSNLNSNPSEAQWRQTLARQFGGAKANALADAMKAARPNESIAKLSYGVTGLTRRNVVQRVVRQRHAQGGAPVYQYWFVRQTPVLDGRSGAYHCSELPFCFDNVHLAEQGTGATPEAYALAAQMSQAWVNFATSGDPSQPGLSWSPSDPERAQTMVWDDRVSRMVDDPEGAVRRILAG